MNAKQTVKRRPSRVLTVEHDLGVTRMLHIFLAAADFEVTGARGGAEALEVLRREPVDAVILDLDLPDGQDGAVLDRLRSRTERDLPAWVVISTLDRREATEQYGTLGDHFLAKPFDPRHLLRMLRAFLCSRERGGHESRKRMREVDASSSRSEANGSARLRSRRGRRRRSSAREEERINVRRRTAITGRAGALVQRDARHARSRSR